MFLKIFFFAALIVITILAFLPNYDALPPIVSFSDLLNHAVAFIVLFILASQAYPTAQTKQTVLLLILYALFIEAVQYYLPTRFASWSDIGADGAGLLAGYLILSLLRRFTYTKNLFS